MSITTKHPLTDEERLFLIKKHGMMNFQHVESVHRPTEYIDNVALGHNGHIPTLAAYERHFQEMKCMRPLTAMTKISMWGIIGAVVCIFFGTLLSMSPTLHYYSVLLWIPAIGSFLYALNHYHVNYNWD